MAESWGMDVVRSFFAAIDRAIYGLLSTIYQIILDLAKVTILDNDVIRDMYSRIYALLAIFMFFKITFSFVNYVINPDQFTDKQKGVQNLIKNAIIVLVMIIITPFAFGKLADAQSAIIGDRLIPKLIVGAAAAEDDAQSFATSFSMSEHCPVNANVANDGDYLSLVTFRPFYQIEPGKEETDRTLLAMYCINGADVNISSYLQETIYNRNTNNIYTVDYKFFVSTIVGIVVCLILISFCFDIAVRSIKLAFLQMIAPVPIISYIDPASSKNGMFSKWIKQVGATWASLFVRLVAVFFAVLVISMIDMNSIKAQASEGEHSFWIMLFILIGALIFAKQLPKLIEELIPGLKLGGMQLNPFKKVANDALGGKQLLGAATAAAGLGATALATTASNIYSFNRNRRNLLAARDAEKPGSEKYNKLDRELQSYNFRRALGTTLGGLGGGAYRGLISGFKTGVSGKVNIFGNMAGDLKSANTARNNRANINRYNREVDHQYSEGNISEQDWRNQRYGFFERHVTENADKYAGVKNEHGGYGYYDKKVKDLERDISNLNQTEQAMRTALSQKTNYFAQLLEINDSINKGTARNDAIQNVARNSGISLSTLAKDFIAYERDLKNISYVDSQQKVLKAEKKNYEDMMSARQEVKK